MRDGRSAGARLGLVLFVALAVLTVSAFAITRAVRGIDDIVNTVVVTPLIGPGESADISFELTEPDDSADVIVLGPDDGQVRAIETDVPLEAGPQEFTWDGRDDDGEPVAAGDYRLRIVLAEQGREIEPPGTITVSESGGA